MAGATVPKPVAGDYNSIAAQYARAKAAKDAEDAKKVAGMMKENGLGPQKEQKTTLERLYERKAATFKREWCWVVGFFVWLL